MKKITSIYKQLAQGILSLLRKILPDLEVSSVEEIPWSELQRTGYVGVLFDLENTIALRHAPSLTNKSEAMLIHLQKEGFKLGFLSNSRQAWVATLGDQHKVPYIAKAGKPFSRGFLRLTKQLGLDPKRIIFVGDQRLTDILGANRLGMYTILVPQLGPDEPWTSKLQRFIVPILMKSLDFLEGFHKKSR